MHASRENKEKVCRQFSKLKKRKVANILFRDEQTHYLQMCKSGSKRKIRSKFSATDDKCLLELFKKHGSDWNLISREMGRSVKEVRDRYVNYLSPPVTRKEWEEWEDCTLLMKVVDFGLQWPLIAGFFGKRRTPIELKNRYCYLQNYLKREPELLRMNKRILRSGTLYYWVNTPFESPMIGTGTNAITRSFVRHTDNIPAFVRRSIASDNGITANSEFKNTIIDGQHPDAGHIRSNQNGGYGDSILTVFPQNCQINRGNYLDGHPTFNLWRGIEVLEQSLHTNGQVSFNTVMLYNDDRPKF